MSSTMNPNKYTTENPIVLNIKLHGLLVTQQVMTKAIELHINHSRTKLTLIIDAKPCNIPPQYHNAMWRLLHHRNIYQRTASRLMEYLDLHVTKDTYTSIMYYYCNMLLAFVEEVSDNWQWSNKLWCSVHLDYHFTMAIHDSAFIEPMQANALRNMDHTWDDFKCKKIYKPVLDHIQEVTVDSYHTEFCNEKNMCGVPNIKHKHSVDDMITSIIQQVIQSTPKLAGAAQAMKEDHTHSETNAVKATVGKIDSVMSDSRSSDNEDNDMHKATNLSCVIHTDLVDLKEDGLSLQRNQKGSHLRQAAHMASSRDDNVIDMSFISLKTQEVHNKVPCKALPMEEDKVNQAADVFESNEDACKGQRNQKGVHQNKHTIGSAMSDRQSSKGHSNCPSKNTTTKAKQKVITILDSDDEGTTGISEIIIVADLEEENVSQDLNANVKIQTSQMAMHPQSGAIRADTKGKGKMILLSDDSDRMCSVMDGQSHIDLPPVTAEDLQHFKDTDFPSMFEDWEEWNHIVLQKGNSQVFLKLGTWILLQFRQLMETPIHGYVEGLLILDHPAAFDINNEVDYWEALRMTHLYSALTHVDTHPEYLSHLFHKLGKASCEGQLESSNPGLRPLPELPTPVLSMMVNKQLPWLKVLPFEDFLDSDDPDAKVLEDMVISGMQDLLDELKDQGIPKHKRTTSTVGQSCSVIPSSLLACHPTTYGRIAYQGSQQSFTMADNDCDETLSGSVMTSDAHVILPSPVDDDGAVHDISAWTKSNDNSHMHMSSQSEATNVSENVEDDSQDIVHAVDMVDVETGDGMRKFSAISEPPTSHTSNLDEDVRVLAPSTPE
ncbi:uncharacterized protein BJ212DRAFT_1304432 [Suillus subaureus]|uniref:Uncharacterized protein n=1 Tax=Suillus subaureus TaxID=48587 RepID=A0A9P7J5J5_9AGAM|nr:uncharacterized protein BJ212DRAFT_1304432 [Suillus subaureus]KAG1804133.1 hypothetical protein BJ212DRAFT_1304432 [Suillus subaureus]